MVSTGMRGVVIARDHQRGPQESHGENSSNDDRRQLGAAQARG